jgi:hypothetical protein
VRENRHQREREREREKEQARENSRERRSEKKDKLIRYEIRVNCYPGSSKPR